MRTKCEVCGKVGEGRICKTCKPVKLSIDSVKLFEKQKARYVLIANKPTSELDRLGCFIESYNSDYQVHNNLTEEELVELIAEYRTADKFMREQEFGYDLTIIKGELIYDDDTLNNSELMSKAKNLIENKKTARQKELDRQKEEEENKKRERIERIERDQLERLKNKYEG